MPSLASLLDNPAVLSYLENLGSDRVLPASADRTDNSEFRAGVAALDEGIGDGSGDADEEAFAPAPLVPVLVDDRRLPGLPGLPAPPADVLDAAVAFVFLMGMTLLGASAAAVVFRAQLLQILAR